MAGVALVALAGGAYLLLAAPSLLKGSGPSGENDEEGNALVEASDIVLRTLDLDDKARDLRFNWTVGKAGNVPNIVPDAASLEANIRERILRPSNLLYLEPTFLVNEELREPRNYLGILRAIGQGQRQFSFAVAGCTTEELVDGLRCDPFGRNSEADITKGILNKTLVPCHQTRLEGGGAVKRLEDLGIERFDPGGRAVRGHRISVIGIS